MPCLLWTKSYRLSALKCTRLGKKQLLLVLRACSMEALRLPQASAEVLTPEHLRSIESNVLTVCFQTPICLAKPLLFMSLFANYFVAAHHAPWYDTKRKTPMIKIVNFQGWITLNLCFILSGRWIMPQPRKSQISLIDTPYFVHNIHVVHFFEAT